MKPLVYLAGPFSKPDPFINMREAFMLASRMLDDGVVTPLVPHHAGVWHLVTPRPYEEWLAYDIELLALCDALLRFGGASDGADKEVQWAFRNKIPVFPDVASLYEWVATAPAPRGEKEG